MNDENTIEMMKREFFDVFTKDDFNTMEDISPFALDYVVIDHVIFGYGKGIDCSNKFQELIYDSETMDNREKRRNKKLIQFLFHNRELIKFWRL